MARGVNNLEARGDAVEGDMLTILQRLGTVAVTRIECADGGAGHLPQALRARCVIIVAVSNQNQCHLTCVAVHNVEMAFILWTRVYDDRPGVFSGANNPRIRPLKGGVAGVITKDYANGLADGTQLTICGVLHSY